MSTPPKLFDKLLITLSHAQELPQLSIPARTIAVFVQSIERFGDLMVIELSNGMLVANFELDGPDVGPGVLTRNSKHRYWPPSINYRGFTYRPVKDWWPPFDATVLKD